MAKGNMLLGQARGKVGSLVFSRSNGKQITRSRAEVVKNPRTLAQYIQRVFMNTASQAYSYGKAIFDHSFEGKSAGQETMSEFMSKNLEYMRKRVAELLNSGYTMDDIFNFVPVGQSGLAPGAWIISRGQLPKVNISLVPYTDYGTSKVKIAADTNTYQAIIEKYNLQRGDQITIVTCEMPLNSADFYFNYARVILDPRDVDGTALPLSTPFIAEGAINAPNSKNEGNFGSLAFETNAVVCKLTNGDVASAGVIVSRKVNDVWERSDCQMILQEDVAAQGMLNSLAGAIEDSEGVTIDVTNALYLNNAGVGGRQSTTSGGSSSASSTPAASNNVSITANGSTATQNIAGGSTTVTGTLTKVVVSGTLLDELEIKAGTTNNAASASALTLSNNNTKATWEGSVAAGGHLYVFKGSTLWFSIATEADGGFDGN